MSGCSSLQLGAANLIENGNARTSELAHGDGPRQRYDVYRPADADGMPLTGPLPVVIFVHGGSWETGDKRSYRWVGQGLAQQGFIAVLPNYGLMPDRRFPGFVEDVALAIAHVQAQLMSWGGDSARIVLMGHSAGAHISALLAYDARYLAAHAAHDGTRVDRNFNRGGSTIRRVEGAIADRASTVWAAAACPPPVRARRGPWERRSPWGERCRRDPSVAPLGRPPTPKVPA